MTPLCSLRHAFWKMACTGLLCMMAASAAHGQLFLPGAQAPGLSPDQLSATTWQAQWIGAPDADLSAYGVYHFRRTWTLDSIPAHCTVHVSADHGYKLYINGTLVSVGPARGDLNNWPFHTVDLAPWLVKGQNVVAAVVWNFAGDKAMAQVSRGQAEFMLQGADEAAMVLNTGKNWRCLKDEAFTPWTQWSVSGYYVAGPCDALDCRRYPWGWQETSFDDSGWSPARTLRAAALRGARDYYGHWLVPSAIPEMEMTPQRFAAVRTVENATVTRPASGTGKGRKSATADGGTSESPITITVPANTRARVLLDQGVLTTGYLQLQFSGGRDAVITAGYAESLTEASFYGGKGNRNEVENKRFAGYADRITADGGKGRTFTPLYWRTWRYVELQIETDQEALVIDDISSIFSAYPFQLATTFSTKSEKYQYLNDFLTIGWRTARLCAHDTYMDCPYYEQLQYFGDSRIQTMVTMYNTTDTCMVRHALDLGRQSRTAEGITMSRYPSADPQYIPPYALSWIGILYDYWMMREDDRFVKSSLPVVHSTLEWFMQWLRPEWYMDQVPFWYFSDWASGYTRGEPPREAGGHSAFQDLDLVLALDAASRMENALGLPDLAAHYSATADSIRQQIRRSYWDASRGLFADTHRHTSWSQHVNTMAVLAGVTQGGEAADVMRKVLDDKTLTQCSVYYRYYLQQAMDQAGLGEELLDHLEVLKSLAGSGLTTWAETADPARSDCHAWGASLNVEVYRMLLGIRSGAAGFSRVIIKPSFPLDMQELSGSMPHPRGTIAVSYKVSGRHVRADISLPEGVEGALVWRDGTLALHGGAQTLQLPLE